MPVSIHRDGFIRGGACHKRLNDRARRTRGAWMAWNDAIDQRCVTTNHGWMHMTKEPKRRPYVDYGGGNVEIGFLRACQEIFSQVVQNKRAFRMAWMRRWLDGGAKLEFGVSSKTPLGPFKFGLVKSKRGDDELYDKGHAKSYPTEVAAQARARAR